MPSDKRLIYTKSQLTEFNIDLEECLLWYYIKHIDSVVFYKWRVLSDDAPGASEHFDIRKHHYTIVPCFYEEAKEYYDELVSKERRELAQKAFMEALGMKTYTETSSKLEVEGSSISSHNSLGRAGGRVLRETPVEDVQDTNHGPVGVILPAITFTDDSIAD